MKNNEVWNSLIKENLTTRQKQDIYFIIFEKEISDFMETEKRSVLTNRLISYLVEHNLLIAQISKRYLNGRYKNEDNKLFYLGCRKINNIALKMYLRVDT